jgi:hypothetical protein
MLYGAVRMPNGPFTVLYGNLGKSVLAADHPSGVAESDGGPLYLYVEHDGGLRFVFGLRGQLTDAARRPSGGGSSGTGYVRCADEFYKLSKGDKPNLDTNYCWVGG